MTVNVVRNANAPRFTQRIYNATIEETLPESSLVVKISATDPDDPNVSGVPFLAVQYWPLAVT